ETVLRYVDLDELMRVAEDAAAVPLTCTGAADCKPIASGPKRPRIGVIKDSAFQFYYPDNLEALVSAGADIIYISPLADTGLPDIDALYIGGGFPETHAPQLTDNLSFRKSLKSAADEGLPIYAECGGLMYLGERLVLDRSYPMAGVLPIVFGFSKKPQGHGYTMVTVDSENPFYPVDMKLRGHEFHYSQVLEWRGSDQDMVFSMQKGRGIINKRDGVCYRNVLATYTHVHALGVPQWAGAMVRAALKTM
ncbi:MAG: cobyrinic acid a,c-diamide synthase, partial [Desulfobacterales bacterium]